MISKPQQTKGFLYWLFMRLPFKARHNRIGRRMYGAWRWRSMEQFRTMLLSIIMPYVIKDPRMVVDFGGALGPLGFGFPVVDLLGVDIWRRPTLRKMPDTYRVVFSSHALEHLESPQQMLQSWIDGLPKRGWIVLNLPSDKAYKYWHPKHKAAHKWLFTLDQSKHGTDRMLYVPGLLPQMDILRCEYSGDDCIFVAARKGYL